VLRVDGEELHVERQLEVVGDEEVLHPGWDVEGAVVLELQEHREARLGLVVEVQADQGPDLLGLARGLEVHVDHEIGSGLDRPCHALRFDERHRSGLPEQEMTFRVERCGLDSQIHPAETRLRIPCVERSRGARAIDQDVRVMHDLLAAGADLDRVDVPGGADRHRQHEVAKHIGALAGQRVWLRHLEHEVRFPVLPAGGETREAGTLRFRTLWCAFFHPFRDRLNLRVRQPALAHERAGG